MEISCFSVGYVSSFSAEYVCLFLTLASSIFVSRRFARLSIFQMAPNGIPLKKQIIESSNQIAQETVAKPISKPYFLPLLLEFIQEKNIYSIEIFLLLSSKKMRGQLFYVSCRTSSLGSGIPIQKLWVSFKSRPFRWRVLRIHQTEASANTCPGRAQSEKIDKQISREPETGFVQLFPLHVTGKQ